MMFGEISGGHFNPAVTLGVLVREGMEKIGENICFALIIIVSQIFGTVLGVSIVRASMEVGDDGRVTDTHTALLCPASRRDPKVVCSTNAPFQALITEIMCTFVFVSVILNIKYLNGSTELAPNAFTIGATLTGMIIVAAKTSGAAINPAIGIT